MLIPINAAAPANDATFNQDQLLLETEVESSSLCSFLGD